MADIQSSRNCYPCVYLDGISLKRTWGGEVRNVSVLVAIGVADDGFRDILGIAEGCKEDKAGWSGFLAHLKKRGLKGLLNQQPTLLADGGVENFNSAVDELVRSGLLRQLLAQTDISYSNSLIESWWRSLKHQWLFLNTLDTINAVKKLVSFYVEQHNTHLPHSAFRGQTPDEMYFGTGDHIPDELNTARKEALDSRMAVNRSVSCPICEPLAWINN